MFIPSNLTRIPVAIVSRSGGIARLHAHHLVAASRDPATALRSRGCNTLHVAPNEPQESAMWERFDALMAQIATNNEPYWLGTNVLGCLVDAIAESTTANSVYLIWADLTDRYEQKVEERPGAEAEMRRAASEWLAVSHDAAARERYLDHWR
jgi:hypothetical protein